MGAAVADVRKTFGENAFGAAPHVDATVSTLMRAIRFRGQEAHSFVTGDADNVLPLMAATHAMEALCYLLTLQELPMGNPGKDRALHSRMVRAHHWHCPRLPGERAVNNSLHSEIRRPFPDSAGPRSTPVRTATFGGGRANHSVSSVAPAF